MTAGAAEAEPNLAAWLARHVRLRPTAPALADETRQLDYAELDRRARHCAGVLREHGVGRGDRVALVLGNCSAYLETIFAASRLGAIAVPLNARLTPPELHGLLADCRPRLLLHDGAHAEAAGAACEGLASAPARLSCGGSPDAYEAALAACAPVEAVARVSPDDAVILMYTSGTTGSPKGALLPQRKALYNSLNAEIFFGLTPADRVLVVLPLFHSFGLQILSLPALHTGASVVLQARFDAERVWQTVGREGITYLGGVPTMFRALLRALEAAAPGSLDLSRLRFLFTAGAAIPVELIHAFGAHGLVLKQGFGQTETSILCCLDAADAIRKAGSVGRPVRHAEVRVVGLAELPGPPETWRDVAPGETGEIVVRGPITMIGYWEKPEATAEVLRGEWLRTGDLATRDAEGFVTLVGRARHMYISGGENVYPTEIEHAYDQHPAIREIAVVGVPDEQWGEVGHAFCVTEAGAAFDEDELRAWGSRRLADFKLPRRFFRVKNLPRTETGKVKTFELVRRQGGAVRLWLLLALLALALLAAGAAALWAERQPLVERAILEQLRARGVAPAELSVTSVGPRGLALRDVRLGDGDLTLRAIEVAWSPAGLAAGRLDAVRAEGLRVAARLRGGALELGVLDALRAPGAPGSQAAPLALPAGSVELAGVELVLETDQGEVSGTFERARATAAGSALRVEADGGTLHLPGLGFEASGIALAADLDPAVGLPQGVLSAARIRDLRGPQPLPDAALELRFAPGPGGLALDGTLRDLGGRLAAHLRGTHDPATGQGSGQLHLDPLRLGKDAVRLRELLPGLAALPAVDGTLEAHGELRWEGAQADGHLDVALRDLKLRAAAWQIERLNGVIRIAGPSDWRIPSGQLVSMARVDFGLELTHGLVKFGVDRAGVVSLASAEWRFAGGSVRTHGKLDLFAQEQALVLEVDGVDLEQLLALVNLDGLSGTGRISGRLPLRLRPGRIEIEDALLSAGAEGGSVRYRPHGQAAALGGAGGYALDDLLAALADFRYEKLELRMDGDVHQQLVVQVALHGANPAHRDAQPYHLNLNVEGALGDLLRQGSAAYQIPDRIQERLRALAAEGG